MIFMLRVYIPVYNEENRIEEHVRLVHEYLSHSIKGDFKITLVDDSSTDGSLDIMRKLSSKNQKIDFKTYANGPSRRENLAAAMSASDDDDIVCFLDIDLSTNLNRLQELIRYIESGYDIAVGSRYMDIRPKRNMRRLLLSEAYNLLIRLLFSSKIYDLQCGFKAFKGRVLKQLVEQAGYDSTLRRGWFWDAEILIRAQRGGYKVREFGVEWSEGLSTSLNFVRELKILPYAIKFRLKT
jgi:glycosyltransferase AglD